MMDVLVLPSRTEGIPAVVIEAAMNRVPVVATNVGGVAETMANGVEGVLVDDASVGGLTRALASVLDGPARTTLIGGSKEQLLARYDITQAAIAWDELLAKVAATRTAPSRPS